MERLESLYNEKSKPSEFEISGVYGGGAPSWVTKQVKLYSDIRDYEAKFNLLDGKTEISDAEKRKIDLTTKYQELFLEDYGLTMDDFEEENKTLPSLHHSELQKTLVKQIPNLKIKNNIRYL